MGIYSQNVSGARRKTSDLTDFLAATTYKIVAIQETWFNQTIDSNEIMAFTNFNIYREDRDLVGLGKKDGGGLAIFIHRDLEYEEFRFGEKVTLEYQALHIKIVSTFYTFLNVYIRPGKVHERRVMIHELDRVLNALRTKYPNDELIMLGDYNMPNIVWHHEDGTPRTLPSEVGCTTYERAFIKVIQKYSLIQLNNISNSNGAILDLVLSSSSTSLSVEAAAPEEAWDKRSISHIPLAISYTAKKSLHTETLKQKMNNRILLQQTKSMLENLLFPTIDFEDSIIDGGLPVIRKINKTIENVARIQRQCTIARKGKDTTEKSHPWARGRKYLALKRARNAAQRVYYLSWLNADKAKLKRANIDLMKEYNKQKSLYYARLIQNSAGKSRELFTIMKEKRKPTQRLPIRMTYNGQSFYGASRAQKIAEYLESCFIPSSMVFSNDFDEYDIQLGDIYREHFTEENTRLWDDFSNEFGLNDVCKVIDELSLKKDCGPMGIATALIKYNSATLAPILKNLFDGILMSGRMPANWKDSYLIPIPKKGNSAEISNYRGISIQSNIPKLFDKLITRKLLHHIESIIPTSQHGFMRARSTTTNLMCATEYIQTNIYARHQVDAIYFDLSKAFDRVDHKIMAQKLAKLGMPYSMLRAIMTFITNRTSHIRIEQTTQNFSFQTTSAVPQGSCCGPILFMVYCLDIPLCVRDSRVLLLSFADDTKFLSCIRGDHDRKQLQVCIDRLSRWADENRMTINANKTVAVSYTNNGLQRHRTAYFVGRERIRKEEQVRDLGVCFDKQMTFKHHIQRTTQKATAAVHTARRFVTEIKAPHLIIQVARTYILPVTEYCAPVWTHHRVGEENELEKIQKIYTRIALSRPQNHNHPNYINYEARRRQLRLPTMRERREIAVIVLLRRLHRKEINCEFLRRILLKYRNRRTSARRIPLIYTLPRGMHNKNSMTIAMKLANHHKDVVKWTKSSSINKKILKEYFTL